jgi:wobble nucleotide-excising tRNase
LEIKYIDGTYKLFCAGKNVKPCDVSVGERNIIGLSYFFTHILNNQDVSVAYGKEYLLVLDDPISSYDRENRIGILSFLKYKLGLFLEGNINTKALVMSHDLMTFYDLGKVFDELIDSCKNKGYPNRLKFNCYELKNCSVESFPYKNRHEYTQLMEKVFNYAVGQAESQYEIVIGNMIRQVLEAFSTFEYKKAIEKVSTDKAIILSFADERYGVYFENLMYRLVLHGGSHKEERVKSMDDLNFFSLISEEEKRRTAKDVLCFIYLLNKAHLLAHLRDVKDQDVENTLNSWCESILQQVSVPDKAIV